MAAYTPFNYADPTVEQLFSRFGAFSLDFPQGVLWTAAYGLAGPNTITIQFTDQMQSASTTASDYILSGPSAPSVSSASFTAGSREVLLTLSGPLSVVNTYTLSINDRKAQSGFINLKWGAINWPNLLVDIILPSQIDCVGVGIQQDATLGTPGINNSGAAVAVGIQQDVDLGIPAITTTTAAVGVGIAQPVDVGDPVSGLYSVVTGVGISQTVALGTPVVVQQNFPTGVGINQVVSLGTPAMDTNPLSPIVAGIAQNINLGTPVAGGSGSVVGHGIAQFINLGTPVAVRVLDQAAIGVGIAQTVDFGTPVATANPLEPSNTVGVGVLQNIALGTPLAAFVDPNLYPIGVGISQTVEVGYPKMKATGMPLRLTANQAAVLGDLDDALHKAFSDGTDGDTPDLITPIEGYKDEFNLLQQQQTRLIFEDLAAATMVALNVPGALLGTVITVPIPKITSGGANGSLTFTDGILTAKVNPT